jgi:haloacetate dehalogenase
MEYVERVSLRCRAAALSGELVPRSAAAVVAADEADRAQGRKIICPTLAIWGNTGIPSNIPRPLDTWREWCSHLEGHGIDSGHFVAEENPEETLAALLPFLNAHAH